MQAISKEIADLESEIEKLGLCLFDDHKLRIRKSFECRRENLLQELERFAQRGGADASG